MTGVAEAEERPDGPAPPHLLGPGGEGLPTTTAIAGGLAQRVLRWGLVAWSIIGIVGVGALLYFAVRPLAVVLPPVAIALVVVYLLNPLVARLERRGIRRGLGVLLIYFLFVAVVVVVLAVLIPIVAHQVTAFIDDLPRLIEKAKTEINQFAAARGSDVRINLSSEEIQKSVFSNRETIASFLGGVRSFATGVLHIMITVLIGFIVSIYLLLDLPKIQRRVVAMIPATRRAEVISLGQEVGRALGGFFRGQMLVATFVGVASAVGLTLVKVPFAVVIGLLCGIFNLVPLIGPFIAAIPAVLVSLLSGEPKRALLALVVLLVVQQIDNHVISPNVMGRTVKLHPITVMLALLAGGTIAGIFGMLIVIPIVAAVKIVGLHFWSRRAALATAVAGGNGGPAP